MTAALLGRVLAAGVLATLTMDLSATACRALGLTNGMQPNLVGRWFGHLAQGRMVHHTIADAAPVAGEFPLALIGHYLIGVTLTATFWWLRPAGAGLGAALAFGLLTNALPWLWMFPSMGFGWFGAAAPPEWMLLRSSFVNHALFGLGLWAATRALG